MSSAGPIAGAAAMMSLCACAGFTQMQDTAAKFDQAVHTASAAEMSLFRQVRAAECSGEFYKQAFEFAVAVPDKSGKYPGEASELDLRTTTCHPRELTDAQLEIRRKLLDTLTLYADSIQTLTNGTADQNLSASSKALAADIKSFAAREKFTSVQQGAAAGLNAAIVTIATLIIDHSSYKHVQEAAGAVRKDLAVVVEELKAENSADAVGLASKADSLVNEMRTGLSAARDKSGPASFVDIVFAKGALGSLIVAPPDVEQLNQALDALVSANDALARVPNGGAIPEITDLTSRAQQASALFNAAK